MSVSKTNRILTAAIVAALASPIQMPAFSAQRAASEPDANAHGCWYYGDENFAGARAKIVGGEVLKSLGDEWDDKISSLTCHPLCTMTAFEEADQAGAQKRFTGDVRSVGDQWDDRISAMSVTCKRRARSIS